MNYSLLENVFPNTGTKLAAWAGMVILGGAMALAQDAGQAGGQRTDGQIEMDVVHALDASAALKTDLITAATIQGEVTLSGTVSSAASQELAESIASHVNGVTKVNNRLKVGNPQNAEDVQAPGAQQVAADNQNDDSMAPVQTAPPNDGPEAAPGQAPYPSQAQNQPYPNQGQNQPYPNQGAGQNPPPYPSQAPYPGQAQGYPPPRPQYAPRQPQYPPQPQYAIPSGPVTIPQGTLLQVRTNEPVASKRAKEGEPIEFTIIRDVALGGVLAIPRGATVHGVVTEVKRSGELAGSPELALRLTSLDLGGQNYPLDSDQFKVKGPNKAGQTVGNAVGGGIVGAIIGCAVGRGVGCAVGAGAGIAAGTAASAASSGPGVWIPAEALVTFHLNTPLTVQPVDAQEASRLAQGLYQGGPSLYRRPGPYYGQPYMAAYPYPPVYYRPYYVIGGAYYWR